MTEAAGVASVFCHLKQQKHFSRAPDAVLIHATPIYHLSP